MSNTKQEFVALDMEVKTVTVKVEGKEKQVKFESKSDVMRKLGQLGFTVSEVAKMTNSHYSFTHTVLSEAGLKNVKQTTSKSDTIREMFDNGKTVGQIAKELNSNYSYCHTVVKKHKIAKGLI